MGIQKKLGFKFLVLASLAMAACSPKIKPVIPIPVDVQPEPEIIIKPVKKFTEATISLLVPFKLNRLNLQTATKTQVENAAMAIDFYQGIKMGIDSASSLGLNFKLNVYDSRDDNAQVESILKKEVLKESNLIIGPVFPDGVNYITKFAIANDMPIVSPLAASKPSEFNNPKLISIVNNIDQHGAKIADFIASKYQGEQTIVVLINPKKTADEQFATPIKDRFKQKYPSFVVQEFTTTYAFETKMIKGKKYAVVICSSDMGFVNPSIDKLFKLKNLKTDGYEINLFGHPNWSKQNYNLVQLQNLNTIISTSYFIDYKNTSVINFVKKYRSKFNFEPSEYSFKGFDIGFYFGKLLVRHGANYVDFLVKEKYKGLHHTFNFAFNPETGYYNTDLMLLQYKNSTLNKIN